MRSPVKGTRASRPSWGSYATRRLRHGEAVWETPPPTKRQGMQRGLARRSTDISPAILRKPSDGN